MELMFIVYLVGVISEIPELIGVTIGLWCLFLFGTSLWAYGDSYLSEKEKERRISVLKDRFTWKTTLSLLLLSILIPNESTMKYMAGAYLIQTVYQSEFTGKVVTLSEKAIINQLEEWAKESPELAPLLQQINKENL